ncbi:MAG: hypothetical protein Q9187_007569, partial [Circinaria calcarea]
MQFKAALVVFGLAIIQDVAAVALPNHINILSAGLVARDGDFKSEATHTTTGYIINPRPTHKLSRTYTVTRTRTTLKATTSSKAIPRTFSFKIFPTTVPGLPYPPLISTATLSRPTIQPIPTFVADTVEQKREIEARAEENTDASTCCDFYLVDRSVDTETDAASDAETKVGYSWKRDLEARAEENTDASTCCDFYLVDRDAEALPEDATP